MAATTSYTMNVELTYTDYSTRTYKLPFKDSFIPDDTNVAAIKTAIRNFNTAAQTDGSSVRQTFLSDSGAPVASVNTTTLVERTEEVLYNG